MKTNNKKEDFSYCLPCFVDKDDSSGLRLDDWRKESPSLGLQSLSGPIGSNNYSMDAKNVHDKFKNYFCSEEGSVDWQLYIITQTA